MHIDDADAQDIPFGPTPGRSASPCSHAVGWSSALAPGSPAMGDRRLVRAAQRPALGRRMARARAPTPRAGARRGGRAARRRPWACRSARRRLVDRHSPVRARSGDRGCRPCRRDRNARGHHRGRTPSHRPAERKLADGRRRPDTRPLPDGPECAHHGLASRRRPLDRLGGRVHRLAHGLVPDGRVVVGLDGGYVRSWDERTRNFELIVGRSMPEDGPSRHLGFVHGHHRKPKKRIVDVLKAQGGQSTSGERRFNPDVL